jgi:hypothetical protein
MLGGIVTVFGDINRKKNLSFRLSRTNDVYHKHHEFQVRPLRLSLFFASIAQ